MINLSRIAMLKVICTLFFCSALSQADSSKTMNTVEIEVNQPLAFGVEVPWFALMDAEDGFSPRNLNYVKKMAENIKAKKIVFAYFATWCIPCRQGISLLKKQSEKLTANGILVVMINVGEEDLAKINQWTQTFADPQWQVLLDSFENISKGWNFYAEGEPVALPRTLVLNEKFEVLKLYGEEGQDWPQLLWQMDE